VRGAPRWLRTIFLAWCLAVGSILIGLYLSIGQR
jgi:hypothetical protein